MVNLGQSGLVQVGVVTDQIQHALATVLVYKDLFTYEHRLLNGPQIGPQGLRIGKHQRLHRLEMAGGHNCPSADRTGSTADNMATFLMTNMMPQAPTNNQRTWAGLENYARTLVNAGNECYLICGSYGAGGTGTNGYATTIDNGYIVVPSNCWKVLVVLPVGTGDATRVTTATRVIAVNMPNSNAIGTAWGSYGTSVDAIEAATGYDILSAVSASVQNVVEAKVDNGPTS